jgi:hypothetical protein
MYLIQYYFSTKIGSGTHNDKIWSERWLVLGIPMTGKKVLECHSSLHASEKELLEKHSGTSHLI